MKTFNSITLRAHGSSVRTLRRFALRGSSGVLLLGLVSCGGNDVTCGAGTTQQGNTCVVKGASTGAGGSDAGSDASMPGTGGASGNTGGATSGSGGQTTGDSGAVDQIIFAGATAAAPGDPGGAANPDALLVTWNLATYPAFPTASIHYEIFSATSSKNETFSQPALVAPAGRTSVLVEGLPSSAPTYFVVRAVSDKGDAKDTNTVEVSGTPKADATPPTFSGVTSVTPLTSSSVLVKWAPAMDDQSPAAAITYRVYWSTTMQGTPNLGTITAPGATQAIVSGLTQANTQYFFTVVAVDAAGNAFSGAPGATGSTAKDTTAPVFGGCKVAMDPTASGGTITWDPAVDDTTPQSDISYNIYAFDVPVDRDTTFATPSQTFKGVASGLVNTLLPATEYRIVCRAVDSSGNEDQNRLTVLLNTISDASPPTFTGSFTANAQSTSVEFIWPQATDDQTPNQAIQYLIFGSTTAGGEDLTTPIYTQTGGTGATLQKSSLLLALPQSDAGVAQKVSNTDFYFQIAAQDQARNQSPPLTEVHVKTLVSFNDDVQPVFTVHCALTGCHVHPQNGVNPPQGQILEAGYTYSSIVNVVALEGAQLNPPEKDVKRIDGTSTNPLDSYLWRKINGGFPNAPIFGSPMPPAYSSGPQLSKPHDFDIIQGWIVQGAQNN